MTGRNVAGVLARHTVVMPQVWPVPLVAVALAVGLTSCAAHHLKTAPTPQSICRSRFSDVLDAELNTVQGVTEVGPRPITMGPGHLGAFTGTTPVTVCLVGKPDPKALDAAIAITPDGKTYTVWRQGGSTHLEPPS